MTLETTPSQTVGPYLSIGLPWPDGPQVVPARTPGRIRLFGKVFDGDGAFIPDALIETWQSDPPVSPTFRGFARCATDADGRYAIHTRKPGPVPGPDGTEQSPHLDVSVFARGLLDRVVTRVYFPDEADANAGDPVLSAIADPARRDTLIAAADTGDNRCFRFDIRLQGEHETVFFDV